MPDESKGVKRHVLFFKPASVMELTGEENNGRVCHIPGAGGVVIQRDSMVPYRTGHIFWPIKDPQVANQLRDLTLSLWTRQDDPTPLSLGMGRRGRYKGGNLTREDEERILSNTAYTAVADHKRYGSQRSQLQKLMIVVLGIAVVCAGLMWLSVPIIAITH